MLRLPAYEQLRILYEQKYPQQQPQSFKIPYYQPALRGMRAYYGSGNNVAELTAARAAARALALASRARHNLRAINAFAGSRQARRTLSIQPQPNVVVQAAPNVELRLQFDIYALESDNPKRLFYNFRNVPIDPSIAKTTLEIAHWVLEQNGTPAPYSALEYIDLESGDAYRINRTAARTTRLISANARIISTLWPTI
jgi:hypothetical protein